MEMFILKSFSCLKKLTKICSICFISHSTKKKQLMYIWHSRYHSFQHSNFTLNIKNNIEQRRFLFYLILKFKSIFMILFLYILLSSRISMISENKNNVFFCQLLCIKVRSNINSHIHYSVKSDWLQTRQKTRIVSTDMEVQKKKKWQKKQNKYANRKGMN